MLATIPPPPLQVLELGPLTVHVYGITFAVGVYLGWRVIVSRLVPPMTRDTMDTVLLRAAGLGLLGARGAYVLTHLDRFEGRPWAVLFVWEGGLAWFGGLTVGVLAGVWLARRFDVPLLPFADAAAIALPIGQALGRWGNYFNQELFGTPLDAPWALEVEPAFRPDRYLDAATFHPTFLYEMVLNLTLVVLLVRMERRPGRRGGELAAAYLVGYGVIRFLMELLRTDTTFRLLGISRNGWVAALVVLGGVLLTRWLRARPAEGPLTVEPQAATGEDYASTGSTSSG